MSQTILVFESDPAFAKEVQYGFGRMGATVHIVTEGHNALEKAKGITPDLIFLSAELKEANGFLLCKEFKRDTSLGAVPLVLTSSDADAETVFAQHQKLRTRAEAYIKKPAPFDSIMAQVGHLVNLQAASEESLFPIEDDSLSLELTGSDDDSFAEELRTVDIEEISGLRRDPEAEVVDISLEDDEDDIDDAILTDRPASPSAVLDAEESTVRAQAQNPTGTTGAERKATRDPVPRPAAQTREARLPAAQREGVRRSTREEPAEAPRRERLPSGVEAGGAAAPVQPQPQAESVQPKQEAAPAAGERAETAHAEEVPVRISSVPAAHPDVMALEGRLNKVVAERDALQAAVAKERELLARERSASAEKIRALEEGLETARAAHASETTETQQVVDLRTKLHEKTKETLAFHQAISDRDRELIEQQERLLVLEKAKGSWEEQQRSLQARTEALLQEGAQLSADLESKTQSERELQASVATLTQRQTELEAQTAELSGQVERLTGERDALREAKATLEQTLSERDKTLGDRESALSKVTQELASLQEALRRVEQVYRDAHTQAADLMRSVGQSAETSDPRATSDGSRSSLSAQRARA